MPSIMWFRRDLRLRDHPALRAAASAGPVLGLFVVDPGLWRSAGPARRAWLAASLRSLDESMGGRLCVRLGQRRRRSCPGWPARWVPGRCTSPTTSRPTARARDRAVVEALPDGVEGVATGTPYAVAPGSVLNGSGQPYKVFTPFSRAWRSHGWDDPAARASRCRLGVARQRQAGRRDARQGPRRGPGRDADGRRGRGAAAVEVLPGRRRRRLRRDARRPRSRPHVPALGLPQARGGAPAPAPGRHRRQALAGRDHLRVRAGLARLLRRRAASPTRARRGRTSARWPG